MLPPRNRLVSKHDFEKVRRFGQSFGCPFFFLSCRRRREETATVGPRFGFITSKRLDKRASHRNRAKRVLREAVRLWLKSWGTDRLKDLDLVFVLRKKSLTGSYEEIGDWINTLLSKVSKL